VEKSRRARQATDDNIIMAHVLCLLDNEGYRHTLSIRNTYCFYTATMVMQTHLQVVLYIHCLSCYSMNIG